MKTTESLFQAIRRGRMTRRHFYPINRYSPRPINMYALGSEKTVKERFSCLDFSCKDIDSLIDGCNDLHMLVFETEILLYHGFTAQEATSLLLLKRLHPEEFYTLAYWRFLRYLVARKLLEP